MRVTLLQQTHWHIYGQGEKEEEASADVVQTPKTHWPKKKPTTKPSKLTKHKISTPGYQSTKAFFSITKFDRRVPNSHTKFTTLKNPKKDGTVGFNGVNRCTRANLETLNSRHELDVGKIRLWRRRDDGKWERCLQIKPHRSALNTIRVISTQAAALKKKRKLK